MSEVFSSIVPCSDCAERRSDLEGTGHHVVDCREDSALPGHCVMRYTRPTAWAAPPAPPLTASQAQAARAIVSLFETGALRGGYDSVAVLPGDTGRLAFGRARATLGSGHLHLLVQRYCATVGARFAGRLRAWLPALAGRSEAADRAGKLHNLLRASADDALMRDVQDAFFDEMHWDPAVRAAGRLGLRSPLAIALVHDGWVQGGWPLLRDRTQAGGALAQAGEHDWVQRYVRLRREWLATHPNALLRASVDRMDAFQRLVALDAWALPLPMVLRGEEISASTLAALPRGCHEGPEPGARELAVGSPLLRGQDVRLVQLALSDQGCDLTADGVYGNVTARCVRAFQRAQDLPETGVADARLVERLLAFAA